jgi:glycosyltransferase involved in cell wall biosynthesis
MKIFFLNNAKLCSGAEEHLLDLGCWLRDNVVEPVFLVRDKSIFRDRAASEGFKVYPVFTDGAKKILSIIRLARLILAEKPDVISVNREHNIIPAYLALIMASPFLKKTPKIVAVFHTPTGRHYPLLDKFDGIICTSKYTANSFMKSNPAISRRIQVIHYGIKLHETDQTSKFNRDRQRRYFRDKTFPVIGMAGELWKNQEELVDVAVRLKKHWPEITIAIVGGGSDEQFEFIRKKIKSCNLEGNFVLTGRVNRDLMPDIFFDFDLSVSTHRNEGFGIVHIESLAACTPVIAYNSGGLVEILAKGGGQLVVGGADQLAEAIIEFLLDDEHRRDIGIEGRKLVEDSFTLESMSLNHFNYYKSLIGKDLALETH